MFLYRGWRRPNGRTDVVRFIGREESWLLRERGRPNIVKVPWAWGQQTRGGLELAYALLRGIGVGPCAADQLASALLADVLSELETDNWALTSDELYAWLADAVTTWFDHAADVERAHLNGQPPGGEGADDE